MATDKVKVVQAEHAHYNNLPAVETVQPVGEADGLCLRELHEVLKKHGKLERFGVVILHKHFDLQPGEVLVETTDEQNRRSTIEPRLANELFDESKDEGVIHTTVFFPGDDNESLSGVVTLACIVKCTTHGFGTIHQK